MLIRTQDKCRLINLDNVVGLSAGKMYGKDEKEWLIEGDNIPFVKGLGKYSSKEKALKVLDMIQKCYENSLYTEQGQGYEMPLGNSYVVINNTVFQMPQDEDVKIN